MKSRIVCVSISRLGDWEPSVLWVKFCHVEGFPKRASQGSNEPRRRESRPIRGLVRGPIRGLVRIGYGIFGVVGEGEKWWPRQRRGVELRRWTWYGRSWGSTRRPWRHRGRANFITLTHFDNNFPSSYVCVNFSIRLFPCLLPTQITLHVLGLYIDRSLVHIVN